MIWVGTPKFAMRLVLRLGSAVRRGGWEVRPVCRGGSLSTDFDRLVSTGSLRAFVSLIWPKTNPSCSSAFARPILEGDLDRLLDRLEQNDVFDRDRAASQHFLVTCLAPHQEPSRKAPLLVPGLSGSGRSLVSLAAVCAVDCKEMGEATSKMGRHTNPVG